MHSTALTVQEYTEVRHAYGVVTSGMSWKFLKLTEGKVYIDLRDYSIESELQKIIGILAAMISQTA